MIEKGILLFIGIMGVTNLFLFILSIYYGINLFIPSYEIILSISKYFLNL
jgi:hypothetical protein